MIPWQNLPVIAAVPNYNMAESLGELLPTLLEQEYDGVVVLDDASTDHSPDVVVEAGAVLIRGSENLGAGGNRNRIIPYLGDNDAIIHFVDADMVMETERVPEIAKELMVQPDVVAVGGLVQDPDGMQMAFNYGPRLTFIHDIQAMTHLRIADKAKTDPEKAERWHDRLGFMLKDWPDIFDTPRARDTFWVSEANMFFDSAAFAKLGGFDPALRYHDIFELSIRMANEGMRVRFDPTVAALHKAIDVRNVNRTLEESKAHWYMQRKHGFRNWLLSPQPQRQ